MSVLIRSQSSLSINQIPYISERKKIKNINKNRIKLFIIKINEIKWIYLCLIYRAGMDYDLEIQDQL
jgi:hypothetical protein